jgi:LysM repeat protein
VVFGGLATVLVAGLLAFIAALGAPQAIASDAEGGQQFAYAVVQPGSSLWSLATELDPSADPRDLVAEIVQLNQLEGSGVDAGQPLAVPLRYSESPAVVSADELGI